jgi:5-methylcytosine-specific restriction endonuclease McrA
MVAEMLLPENEGALLLERLLSSNAAWSPKGSRVDPYRGVDDWVRHWMWYHIRDFVLRRDEYTCQLCGEYVLGKAQLHHIVWRSHNGTDHPKNLMVVCEECHRQVHNKELPLIMLQ